MNLFKIALPATSAGRFERSGYSESLEGNEGFIFSLFGENMPLYMIPYDPEMPPLTDVEINAICRDNDCRVEWVEPVTVCREEHITLVKDIVDHLKESDCGVQTSCKIIATRVLIADTHKSASTIYHDLCVAYPDATVFLFSTPYTGTWIGASPELLLDFTPDRLMTVALAGTREASVCDRDAAREWDSKNIREQQIVTDFITGLLHGHGYEVLTEGPFTRRAGRVEHLCTVISALIHSEAPASPAKLISELSPTPALSGYPRHESIEYIQSHERNPRHCYGGAIGYLSPDHVSAYVNLRSGRLLSHKSRIALYAGGGITRDSCPAAEWDETARKLTTLLPHI